MDGGTEIHECTGSFHVRLGNKVSPATWKHKERWPYPEVPIATSTTRMCESNGTEEGPVCVCVGMHPRRSRISPERAIGGDGAACRYADVEGWPAGIT